jgi:flavodoxin I
MNIGIFYGSSGGTTELAAKNVAETLQGMSLNVELKDIGQSDVSELEQYDALILASSTWYDGQLQDDWEDKIDDLPSLKLEGKKLAFIGMGDQDMYSDNYVDAIGILYEALENSGAELVARWESVGYNFDESKAIRDGKFIGLALDEDNQSELTDSRIDQWCKLFAEEIK